MLKSIHCHQCHLNRKPCEEAPIGGIPFFYKNAITSAVMSFFYQKQLHHIISTWVIYQTSLLSLLLVPAIIMDNQLMTLTSDYHGSKWSEYRLSTELIPINIVFPTFLEIAWAKLQRHCLKIDHYKILVNLYRRLCCNYVGDLLCHFNLSFCSFFITQLKYFLYCTA